jgi:hypothetical protein
MGELVKEIMLCPACHQPTATQKEFCAKHDVVFEPGGQCDHCANEGSISHETKEKNPQGIGELEYYGGLRVEPNLKPRSVKRLSWREALALEKEKLDLEGGHVSTITDSGAGGGGDNRQEGVHYGGNS